MQFIPTLFDMTTSASCGSQSHLTTTAANISNLSVTLNTRGKKVYLRLIPDGATGTAASLVAGQATGDDARGVYIFTRGGSEISRVAIGGQATNPASSALSFIYPPGLVDYVDSPAAGSHTYAVQAAITDANAQINTANVKLQAILF